MAPTMTLLNLHPMILGAELAMKETRLTVTMPTKQLTMAEPMVPMKNWQASTTMFPMTTQHHLKALRTAALKTSRSLLALLTTHQIRPMKLQMGRPRLMAPRMVGLNSPVFPMTKAFRMVQSMMLPMS
jgi:hypothetical protein